MAEKSKTTKATGPDLSPSDADAPGPISPEHESGSFEQTLAEQQAREAYDEAKRGGKTTGGSSKPAAKS